MSELILELLKPNLNLAVQPFNNIIKTKHYHPKLKTFLSRLRSYSVTINRVVLKKKVNKTKTQLFNYVIFQSSSKRS